MDIFLFTNAKANNIYTPGDFDMKSGKIINNLKSKMWVERFSEAGEFELVADVSSNMRNILPIGSFISHIDTAEIMVVENHEIRDTKGQESEIVITGRGFETIMENRIVGANKTFPLSGQQSDYTIASAYIWEQIVSLIQTHLTGPGVIDSDNVMALVEVQHDSSFTTETATAKSVPRGDLYSVVVALLKMGNIGIKALRFVPSSPNTNYVTLLYIYKGVDRTKDVIFSYDTGEITSAEYLWSNKRLKNCAYIYGRWVETVVYGSEVTYKRRMMMIDASDIDNNLADPPSGGTLTTIVGIMQERARKILLNQKDVAIVKADVSRTATKAKYRESFNVGDLITVQGSYNESSVMQISEYVEFEDENGISGYPTLTVM